MWLISPATTVVGGAFGHIKKMTCCQVQSEIRGVCDLGQRAAIHPNDYDDQEINKRIDCSECMRFDQLFNHCVA